MFETNSASCGGFPGISNTYAAALWALEYGLRLGYVNFTLGMLHTGGQKAYYNVSFYFEGVGLRRCCSLLFFLVVCSHLPVNILNHPNFS